MKFFLGLAFLVLLGVVMFAVQNSTAPAINIKFLAWHIQTSLIYTMLGRPCIGNDNSYSPVDSFSFQSFLPEKMIEEGA